MSEGHTLTEALAYGHGIERPFLCPSHGDSRPSASVNVIKKKWYCYTCGAHGGLSGDALLMEPNYYVMARMLEERMEAADRVYPEAWLNQYDAGPVHPYWLRRFDERTARQFRLGYDEAEDSVTYPLRGTSGEVRGVVRRPLDADGGPKYRYPYGLDISRYLFGYTPSARRAVVLVEGAMDAVACWMSGIEAFAIYGSRLSRHQVALIDRVDPHYVYTAFDMDDAGYRAHLDTVRAFPHRLVRRLRWISGWGKDVDEIGPTRREEVFATLLSSGLACVECVSCESPQPPQNSPSTSPPSRMLRLPTSA